MSGETIHPLKYSVHTRLREYHLRRLFPRRTGGRLLDVGCGLGYLTQALGKDFVSLGMDYDIHSLHANRKRGLDKMVRANAVELPFGDQVFDVIVCSELLEHLPDTMDEKAFLEMSRVLKPHGRLLITVPALEGWRAYSRLRNLGHDNPESGEYHHRIGYLWKDLKEMIDRQPSLKVVKSRYAMFFISELFMDLQKWFFLRKNKFKEHSDIMGANESPLFYAYRLVFPSLHLVFVAEDLILCPLFKGHILILAVEKSA